MSTHNVCFRREVRKIICGYPLLSVAMRLAQRSAVLSLHSLESVHNDRIPGYLDVFIHLTMKILLFTGVCISCLRIMFTRELYCFNLFAQVCLSQYLG